MHVLSTCQLESGKCTVEFDDAGMRETNKNTIVNISFSEKIVGAALDGGLNASSLSLPPPLVKKKIGPTVTPKPTTELALDLQVLPFQTLRVHDFAPKTANLLQAVTTPVPSKNKKRVKPQKKSFGCACGSSKGHEVKQSPKREKLSLIFSKLQLLARVPVPDSGRERRQIACQVRKFTVCNIHVVSRTSIISSIGK